MNKTQRSIGVLLLASGWLVACGGAKQGAPGAGGTQGGGGGAGAGGHAGQSSDAAVVSDGPVYPNDAGRCPMQGAYARDGGICVCQADVPTVCDGVCLDTKTNNDHCGDCATKCGPTSVCSKGTCSVPPTVVLAAPSPAAGADGGAATCGPLTLAVAGTTLYWTDTLAGTVNSLPVGGGSPTVIASAQAAPTHLQVAGGNVFWLASGDRKIMKSPVGAATPTPTLVVAAPATDAQVGGFSVSADGLTVYFSSSKADTAARPQGTISKVAAAGGAITVLAAQDHGIPAAVAVDGNTVAFPVDGNGDVNAISFATATLAQCGLPPADGGSEEVDINCSRLGRSQGELFPDDIFAFGGAAYWLDGANLKTGVITNNTSGTYEVITAALNGSTFSAFTMDGTTTSYLAERGGQTCKTWKDDSKTTCLALGPAVPASIEKAPLVKASTAVPLARFVDANDATVTAHATSVAVDGSNVYFATANCAILRVAK